MHRAFPDVLPPESKAFVRSEAAIDQQGGDIAQQERIVRLDWPLTSQSRPDARQRAPVSFLDAVSYCDCRGEVARLFIVGQYALPVVFAGQHFDPRQYLLDLPPLNRQSEHAPQNLQLPVDACHRQPTIPQRTHEPSDLVCGNGVQLAPAESRVFSETLDSVAVIGERVCLVSEARLNER
ncbi:MAG TPA: hypothetical protein VKB79_17820 [Bryobacteraceae bacterium]|nr:hypothetical protein [Bryobacteraceae bacterium]